MQDSWHRSKRASYTATGINFMFTTTHGSQGEELAHEEDTTLFLNRPPLVTHPDSRVAYWCLPVQANPDTGCCSFGQTLTSPQFWQCSTRSFENGRTTESNRMRARCNNVYLSVKNRHTHTRRYASKRMQRVLSQGFEILFHQDNVQDSRYLSKKCVTHQ